MALLKRELYRQVKGPEARTRIVARSFSNRRKKLARRARSRASRESEDGPVGRRAETGEKLVATLEKVGVEFIA